MGEKILYFGYASNLFSKRIHLNNPSAVRIGIGKLEVESGYQLDFHGYSERWRGSSATIVGNPTRHVWGAIWEMDANHLKALDKQEGVDDGKYCRRSAEVLLLEGGTETCWVYEQCNISSSTQVIEQLAEDRRPSAVYLNIIIKGADESGLPDYYQQFLRKVPHNGYTGEVDVAIGLNFTE